MRDWIEQMGRALHANRKFRLQLVGGQVVKLSSRPQMDLRTHQIIPEGPLVEVQVTLRSLGWEYTYTVQADRCDIEVEPDETSKLPGGQS